MNEWMLWFAVIIEMYLTPFVTFFGNHFDEACAVFCRETTFFNAEKCNIWKRNRFHQVLFYVNLKSKCTLNHWLFWHKKKLLHEIKYQFSCGTVNHNVIYEHFSHIFHIATAEPFASIVSIESIASIFPILC